MNGIRNNVSHAPSAHRVVPILFVLTIFLSASLLFFVQPLFAKIALPQIGGAPSVWTTAMLFFQTVLIAGYAYAHFSTRYLPVVWQIGLHIALWALALLFLPLAIRTEVDLSADASVAGQTLLLFAAGVGVPFAVLSANAPLIQAWYAKTGGPSADDPYFLYGASNLGSLGALLAFPLVAEPLFGISQVGFGWSAGFILLGAFLLASGVTASKGISALPRHASQPTPWPGLKKTAFWLFLAFIPSSLMLSVTAKISSEVGSFPLIWVVPLALYLLTFVLTFTNKPLFGHQAMGWMLVIGLAAMAFLLSSGARTLTWTMAVLLVLAFWAIAMVAHRALYEARPDKSQLTYFYMIMSIGGALGGLFNSIIAPVVFNDLYELRIVAILAIALFVIRGAKITRQALKWDVLIALIVVAPVCLAYSTPLGNWLGGKISSPVIFTVMAGLCAAAALFAHVLRRPLMVTLMITLVVGSALTSGVAVFRDRSFFGSHAVVVVNDQQMYVNGKTLHGAQFIEDFDAERPRPLSYYHAAAPMGQIMQSELADAATDIGVVGLGVGALACYTQPGQNWQYYEIDALVDQVARTPELFTFMSNCAGDAPTHIGDARVVLERQTDLKYDILVIDAYSSDAIPIHLSTKEAIALFRDRLRPEGLLVLHITTRYYDMSGPIARIAEELGLQARIQRFANPENVPGANPSQVVILSQSDATMAQFDPDPRWVTLQSDGKPAWTDDYANILSALK